MAARRTFSVMLSSSFNDLKDLRDIVAQRLDKAGLHPIRMEVDDALPEQDVIDASLAKVDDADAYFCLIGRKYGSIPNCPTRNPDELSTTALEFHRAKAQEMPVAGVMLGVNYPVGEQGVEFDADKRAKLETLREALTEYRVVRTIENPNEFAEAVLHTGHELRKRLEARAAKAAPAAANDARQAMPGEQMPPAAPALYEVRPFSQGMEFVGRARELDELSDWARNDVPLLVVEAIGGMGKSTLAHRWLSERAPAERADAAGRLWYSFYEEGASMRDFCVHALAYVEGTPPGSFSDIGKQHLGDRLLRCLSERPWLLVLDGLERLLVAYDRHDKAQMADEEADRDRADGRDPNLCIDPQDDNLLRRFAGARPSKLLATSRNMPSHLLGPAGTPVPGVAHESLTGLAQGDAESLLRQAGVRGDGAEMRRYLSAHFDCHPLMVGVVAGLVRHHAPAPGDFDHWLRDPEGARDLDLSKLDGLVAKRNHILTVAFQGLHADTKKLLARLAFVSHAVGYPVLQTLNPRRPAPPEPVPEPQRLPDGEHAHRKLMLESRVRVTAKEETKARHRAALEALGNSPDDAYKRARAAWDAYQDALRDWRNSDVVRAADRWLGDTLADLRRRGLVICNDAEATYDLHPLVRGFVRGALDDKSRAETGQLVADYARSRAPTVLTETTSAAELDDYLDAVHALQLGGHTRAAAEMMAANIVVTAARTGRLRRVAQLLDSFFRDVGEFDPRVPDHCQRLISNQAGIAAGLLSDHEKAYILYRASIQLSIQVDGLEYIHMDISNLAETEARRHKLAAAARLQDLGRAIAKAIEDEESTSNQHFNDVLFALEQGRTDWRSIGPQARLDDPDAFQGHEDLKTSVVAVSVQHARRSGTLSETALASATNRADVRHDRLAQRRIFEVKGRWRQERGDHTRAIAAFDTAIQIGRADGLPVDDVEAARALSHARIGRQAEARAVADRLAQAREPAHLDLAEVWLALGETDLARAAALAAYPKCWADGPPYAFHFALERCRAVLAAVGAPEPSLPPRTPEEIEPYPFEDEVHRLIAEHEAAKAKRQGR